MVAAPLRAASGLPPRDLIVELRLVDAATVVEGGAAAGGITIDSRGHVRGDSGVSTVATTGGSNRDVQAVRVSNGGRARMQLVQTQALTGAVALWAGDPALPIGPGTGAAGWPRAGAAGSVVTTWAELVDGLEVQPRWPGGRAPVAVEIGAQRTTGAAAGNAPPPRIDVYTTLQAPIGEWVELAQVRQGARATVSAGSATVGTQRALQLQLRVRPAD